MNIFFIPSWYPHPDYPINGIFIKEQAEALTDLYPNINIGISLWGQKDERLLLWAKDHFKNIIKVWNAKDFKLYEKPLKKNFSEYFTPALIWTRKILHGNIKSIIKANEENIKMYESKFGKIDLIHAHVGFPAGYIAHQLKSKYNIPYIITEQMSPFPFEYYLTKKKELIPNLNISYKNSSANIAISPSLLNDMKNYNIENLNYIPNLVNEETFTLSSGKNKTDTFIFFSLGRLVEQKGFPDLLKAFKIVKDSGIKVQLNIGGDGSKKNEYQKLASDLNIDQNVKWLGLLNKEQIVNQFMNCDAFVLPSLHETMGVVFAEAIACGKPIISTYCGGVESIVTEKNGYLVNIGDIDNLALKMIEMTKKIEQFDPVQIREDFLKKFSRKIVCDKLVDLYKLVIKNNYCHPTKILD